MKNQCGPRQCDEQFGPGVLSEELGTSSSSFGNIYQPKQAVADWLKARQLSDAGSCLNIRMDRIYKFPIEDRFLLVEWSARRSHLIPAGIIDESGTQEDSRDSRRDTKYEWKFQ